MTGAGETAAKASSRGVTTFEGGREGRLVLKTAGKFRSLRGGEGRGERGLEADGTSTPGKSEMRGEVGVGGRVGATS